MITAVAKMAQSLRQNIFAGCFPMIKSATDLIIVTNAAVGGAEVTVTVDPRTATAGLDTLDTIATAQT